MIVPSDEDYIETKLVKLGKRDLSPAFNVLAAWIGERYGASPLNIHYDILSNSPGQSLPRLNVIFEYESEERNFRSDDLNFDSGKQTAIAAALREILASRADDKLDVRNLFVYFSAFEPVARIEANWRVTTDQTEDLRKRLACPDLWKIRPEWEDVVFFFYTDAQLTESMTSDRRHRCSDEYAALLGPYDEFGYFRARPPTVSFDSKENFETKYNGSWFNYTRR